MSKAVVVINYGWLLLKGDWKLIKKAYTLWQKLVSLVYDEKQSFPVVNECQDWWFNNCLFLEEEARKAFINACTAAVGHKTVMNMHVPRAEVERNWENIMRAVELLVKGVELPPIAEDKPEKPPEDIYKTK